MSDADDTGEAPPGPHFFDLVELISAQHRYVIADLRSVRADRNQLRRIVEGLLAVLGQTVDAAEIARWRQMAGLPEALPSETPPSESPP